jgi:hypothetical protein
VNLIFQELIANQLCVTADIYMVACKGGECPVYAASGIRGNPYGVNQVCSPQFGKSFCRYFPEDQFAFLIKSPETIAVKGEMGI